MIDRFPTTSPRGWRRRLRPGAALGLAAEVRTSYDARSCG